MTDVASVPTVTEITKAEDAKLFVDDKKSRSDLECFVHEEYFVPKTEEHLIRPPVAPEEKRTEAGIVMGSLNYPLYSRFYPVKRAVLNLVQRSHY